MTDPRDVVAMINHETKIIYICTSVEFTNKSNAGELLRKRLLDKNARKDWEGNDENLNFLKLAVVDESKAQEAKKYFSENYKNIGYEPINNYRT